ncbi:MAG: diaminopimelate epimerase [Luteibaculaceae bacterium]
MELSFLKYQGTGNDFIIVDGFNTAVELTNAQIRKLCDRKFGIGSDGLIILKPCTDTDFYMDFYNPDASQSFCGNGSRCAVAAAGDFNIISSAETTFKAIDGIHTAKIDSEAGWVSVKMKDTAFEYPTGDTLFLHTGSPHHLCFVDDVDAVNIAQEGAAIRYSPKYKPAGTNVNFVAFSDSTTIKVRTYERGVEAETLSCGTGVTAAALGSAIKKNMKAPIRVETLGGTLEIDFAINLEKKSFEEVFLSGPAKLVFRGIVNLEKV